MPLIADGAGELRARARFSRPNSVEDEFGNVSTGWEDMFTVSANFTPRLGGEAVEAARLEGRQPVIVRVRYSPDTKLIRPDWRATNVDSGIVYNIRSVVDPNMGNPQHGKWIEALAEAGVAI